MTIRIGIAINFGWVTTASILGIAVTFKKFNTSFYGRESSWAIAIITIATLIYTAIAFTRKEAITPAVFVYVNFTLWGYYNNFIKNESKSHFIIFK